MVMVSITYLVLLVVGISITHSSWVYYIIIFYIIFMFMTGLVSLPFSTSTSNDRPF